MRGRYLIPRVISAYYTPSSKSRRSLTLCNAFLRLRRKKALDQEKISDPEFMPINASVYTGEKMKIDKFWYYL
jgi:hypothetical protein